MDVKTMIKLAFEAREKSYSPYSNFKVGASLLTKSGKIYQGCNIENIAFSSTNCAERTAFFKAVSEGDMDFESICVVGGLKSTGVTNYSAPCGVCRQVMLEFCDPETFTVYIAKSEDDYIEYKLKDLIPEYFSPLNQKIGV